MYQMCTKYVFFNTYIQKKLKKFNKTNKTKLHGRKNNFRSSCTC